MSEKTFIGGTLYESVGSSKSNLLLKCNGTARIQWGSKLIDLIKDGKIQSSTSDLQINIVQDESEITSDGLYIISQDDSQSFVICKSGQKYNLTGADLYISTSTNQNITAEQKSQALQNIGIYYNTLEEAKNAGIQNGLIYITSTKQLYTVLNGKLEEFSAKLQTITVENKQEQGEVINSSVKIVLSVLDQEYLVLSDQRVYSNYSIHVNNAAQLGSDQADSHHGYRLYMNGDVSYLDVDEINVRNGIKFDEYLEVTFEEIHKLYTNGQLIPHQWYLIKDFQNHWRLPKYNIDYNRPILVQALTGNTFYEQGKLYKDRTVSLNFDITYIEPIDQYIGETIQTVKTKGKITWMKDRYNNEANFDFLDYYDADNQPLTTLHNNGIHNSIFPVNSYNNTLFAYDLYGTMLVNNVINNSQAHRINFAIEDTNTKPGSNVGTGIPSSKPPFEFTPVIPKGDFNPEYQVSTIDDSKSTFDMHDNYIICQGFVVQNTCTAFYNNKFKSITDTEISKNMINCEFHNVQECQFHASFEDVVFKDLTSCIFEEGTIKNVNCKVNLANITFNSTNYQGLYNPDVYNEIYLDSYGLQISDGISDFRRGMIVMHSGVTDIPQGWAICDGNTYTYNGVSTQTPNLVNRFIKAVGSISNVKEVLNSELDSDNKFTLQEKHLPKHSHPHSPHSHTASVSGSILNTTTAQYAATGETQVGDRVTKSSVTLSGNTGSTTSSEASKTWENAKFSIEPNYYALIFIMKL